MLNLPQKLIVNMPQKSNTSYKWGAFLYFQQLTEGSLAQATLAFK